MARFTTKELNELGYTVKDGVAVRRIVLPKQDAGKALGGLQKPQRQSTKRSRKVGSGKPGVRLTLEAVAARPRDPDNVVAGAKGLIDALRYSGLIVDDSPCHIELCVRSIKAISRDGQKVFITLERLPREKETIQRNND